MNLNENIDRIKQVMGIITESKSISKMIDELGVIGSIKFVGDEKKWNSKNGCGIVFDVSEILKQ